jgi:hypothetical protein
VPQARLLGLWGRLGGDKEGAGKAAKALAANPGSDLAFLTERLRQAAAREAPYARLMADLDSDSFETREDASRRLEKDAMAAEFALNLAFAAQPSVDFRKRSEPAMEDLAAARKEEVRRLLGEVDRGDANGAARGLEALGWAAEPALRRFIARDQSEVRLSSQAQLFAEQALERLTVPDVGSVSDRPATLVRAVGVLEQAGNDEARGVLEELAKGPKGATLAREARAAVERLAKRGSKP